MVLIADIEKDFLMVSVAEKDRDVLRFLWIDDPTVSGNCAEIYKGDLWCFIKPFSTECHY